MEFFPRLKNHLAELDRAHLRRSLLAVDAIDGVRLASEGRELLAFCSNDYLGLSQHPEVRMAALKAIERFGTGSGASRLVCGSLAPHHAFESGIARFKGAEAALSFSSGYATALGVIPALVGPADSVVIDRLAHASLVDAARLSRARLRVFQHNAVEDLSTVLRNTRDQAARNGNPMGAMMIVTESVFSMDGDRAPLSDLLKVARQFGAWLFLDEAHATGVVGPGGRGLAAELGVAREIDVSMGTMGKALGSAGGYIAGATLLRDCLLHRARSFMFSTAPPPSAASAARAALDVLDSAEGRHRIETLWARVRGIHEGLDALGWRMPFPQSAILPLMVGPEDEATRLAAALRDEGLLVPAIRFPTVPRGHARLRVTASAHHSEADVAWLLAGLKRAMDRSGIRAPLRGMTAAFQTSPAASSAADAATGHGEPAAPGAAALPGGSENAPI
jgi:8-amino-7-oxononanoate synthase